MQIYSDSTLFQDIDNQLNVNLMGTINAVYTFLPGMRSNSRGRICIISSVGGQIGLWGMSHYCATKFALKGLTEVYLNHQLTANPNRNRTHIQN